MKKNYRFILAAFAIVAAASCNMEVTPEVPVQDTNLVPLTITATMDDLTKAADIASDLSVAWEVGDSVAVFDGVSTTALKFTVVEVNGKNVKLDGAVSETATTLAAVYPMTQASGYADGKLNVVVPPTQTIPAGKKVDGKAVVSVASAAKGETLAFHNVGSLVKFSVKAASTTAVMISSNGGEVFLNAATADPATGVVELPATNTSNILKVNAETTYEPGDYYAVIYPVTFATGVKAVAVVDNGINIKKSEKSATFARSAGLDMGDLTTGGESVPSEITTTAQLLTWSENANAYPAGSVVKLGADIDMAGIEWKGNNRFYGVFDGQNHRVYNLTVTSTTGDSAFINRVGDGTSGGVKNLCVGSKDYDFASQKGTYDGVSKSVFATVNDGADTYYYPGAIAYAYAGTTIENVVNFMAIEVPAECTSPHRTGGVLGTVKANVTIKDCINFGTIVDNSTVTTKTPTIGGLVGALDGAGSTVSGCKNYGKITINAKKSNSSAGLIGYDGYAATITDCANYGDVEVICLPSQASYYGGGIGYLKDAVTNIDGLNNYGKITIAAEGAIAQNIYFGGVIGTTTGKGEIKNCVNEGEVAFKGTGRMSKALIIGGVIGQLNGAGTFTNLLNKGKVEFTTTSDITANSHIAGCIGNTNAAATISNCDNEGDVTASGKSTVDIEVAGVCARSVTAALLKFDGCDNAGTITNNLTITGKTGSFVAGVLARVHQSDPITNCTNTGKVINNGSTTIAYVGGVVGYNQSTATTIEGCVNKGEVIDNGVHTSTSFCGGVLGYTKVANPVNNCTNEGTIKVDGDLKSNIYIGGVLGSGDSAGCTLNECTNSGTIYPVSTKQSAQMTSVGGGIAGNSKGIVKGCTNTGEVIYNSGTVAGLAYLGGISGGNASIAELTGCTSKGAIKVESAVAPNSYAGGLIGQISFKSKIENCVVDNTITSASETMWVGGLAGSHVLNTADAAVSGANCQVKSVITVPAAAQQYAGLVIGMWHTGEEAGATACGTTDAPIKVAGSINGTAVTAANLASMIQGSANAANELHTISAVLAE